MFKKASLTFACGAFAITSMFGGVGSAFAANNDTLEDIGEHYDNMSLDVETSVSNWNDKNDSGFVDKGDSVKLNVKVKNTSKFDYNYVSVSSNKLNLNREKISGDLKAGKTVNSELDYTITENDNISNTINGNVWVNVRDSKKVEKSEEAFFEIGSNGEFYDGDCDIYDNDPERIDGCFEDVEVFNNDSETNEAPIILDKKTNTIYSPKSNSAIIEKLASELGVNSKVVSEDKMSDYYKVGNEFITYINYKNDREDIVEFDKVSLDHSDVVKSNINSSKIAAGEEKGLFFTREIKQDNLSWGIPDSMIDSENNVIVLKDKDGNNYLLNNSNSASRMSDSVGVGADGSWEKEKDSNNNIVEYFYNISNNTFEDKTIDSVVSKKYGSIKVDKVLDSGSKMTVNVPEKENVAAGGDVEEEGFVIYYGKYFTDNAPVGASFSDNVGGNTGGGIGGVIKEPTMTEPPCDTEARVVIPDPYDDYFYESSRDNDKVVVKLFYKIDDDDTKLVDTWTFDIPAVVDCPTPDKPKKDPEPEPPTEVVPPNKVKRLTPEKPTYVPESCDVSESVEIPNVKGIKYVVNKSDKTISVVSYDKFGQNGAWTFDREAFDSSECVVKKVKTGEVVEYDDDNNVIFYGMLAIGFAILSTTVIVFANVRKVK